MLKLYSYLFRNSDVMIKIRLSVYVLALIHLVVMAAYLLSKDFSKSEDPHTKEYVKIKWKLITAWFNILTGPYIVTCIYCEWKDLKQKGVSRKDGFIHKTRHFLFNSIILPVTMFADILFWRLYNKDRAILMPLSAEEFITVWNHHSMHTASLLFVIFDLVFVPRHRPSTASMMAQIVILEAFLTLYVTVCFHSILKGEYVYPALKTFNATKLFLCGVYLHVASLFYYTGQWFVVDMIWGYGNKPKIT